MTLFCIDLLYISHHMLEDTLESQQIIFPNPFRGLLKPLALIQLLNIPVTV